MKIISTSPCRISLFGGGTDVNPYASTYEGLVINLAINLRQKIELDTSRPEKDLLVEDNPYFFNAFLNNPIGIRHRFDAPIESGIGSSAALAVALVGAIDKYEGTSMTRHEIVEKAWDIEVNRLKLFGGRQDQIAACWGGINLIEFGKEIKVTPIKGNAENLLKGMILFYTGKNRKSSKIQEGFKELSEEQIKALNAIKEIALQAIEPVRQGDIKQVGRLLDISWQHKKDSNKGVTNEHIDKIYSDAKKAGALGGKIMGAGGGGFMLLMCLPEDREKVVKSIEKNGSKEVDFGVDYNGLEVRRIE